MGHQGDGCPLCDMWHIRLLAAAVVAVIALGHPADDRTIFQNDDGWNKASSILSVASSSEIRSRILELEAKLLRAASSSAAAGLEEAVKDLRRAAAMERLGMDPTHADGWLTLAVHSLDECEWGLARRLTLTLSRLVISRMPACGESQLEPSMAIRADLPTSLLSRIASRAAYCSARLITHTPLPSSAPATPLRVGYLSSDFFEHKAGLLRRAMFDAPEGSAADNPRISIFLFYSGTVVDGYTSLMQRPASHRTFIHLPKGEATQAAQAVNSQAIHVLVDLNTHNRGGSTSIASLRPAQQILVYPDYPGTSGLGRWSKLASDRVVTPPELAGTVTERLLLLPTTFFLADHSKSFPSVRTAGAHNHPTTPKTEGAVCAPNAAGKAAFRSIAMMKRALIGWRGQVIIGVGHGEAARARFAHGIGIGESRVHSMERRERVQHVAGLRSCIMSLDSASLSAIATGADALWALSPLLTVPGDSFGTRIGASLSLHAGAVAMVCRRSADFGEVGRAALKGHGLEWVKEAMREWKGGLFDEDAWMQGWVRGLRIAYDVGVATDGQHGSSQGRDARQAWQDMHVIVANS